MREVAKKLAFFKKKFLAGLMERGSFVSNLSVVTAGRFFSVLIGLLSTPILTRLYSPEEYGEYNLYFSWIGILQVVATFGFSYGIIPQKTDRSMWNLVFACTIIGTLTSFVVFAVLELSNSLFGVPSGLLIVAVPAGLVLITYAEVFASINVRKKEFGLTTGVEVGRNILVRVMSIFFGFFQVWSSIGLILSDLVGKVIVAVVFFAKNFVNKKGEKTDYEFSMSAIKASLNENIALPKYILPSNLLKRLSNYAPNFFIAYFFGQSKLGFYSISMGLLNLPIQVLGNSISSVFFQRASSMKNESMEVGDLTQKLVGALSFLTFLPFAVLVVFGDLLFSWIFGSEWEQSGQIVKIMAIYFYPMLIAFSIYDLFVILKKEKVRFIFDVVGLLIGLICMAFSYLLNSFTLFLIIYSVFNSVMYIFIVVYLMKQVESNFWRTFFSGLAVMAFTVFILYILRYILF